MSAYDAQSQKVPLVLDGAAGDGVIRKATASFCAITLHRSRWRRCHLVRKYEVLVDEIGLT